MRPWSDTELQRTRIIRAERAEGLASRTMDGPADAVAAWAS